TRAAPPSHRPATTTRRHGHDHREHGTAQRRAHVCGVLGTQDRPPGHRQFAHGCAHRQPEVLHPAGRGLRRQARAPPQGRAPGRLLLPQPLVPRQGRPLHPRSQLHRFVLLARLRQGRTDHLGAQATDYPSPGPDMPEYEPRGCPRGASLSWYTYSPTRARYPYASGTLLRLFREAKAANGHDPVLAWKSIVEDPVKARRYKSVRGKGGLVRATWAEAVEIVAAAYVYTVKYLGPDRTTGFSPIPAMRS